MNEYPISAEKVVSHKKIDTGLLVALILLWGIGLVALYITSGFSGQRLFQNQLYFVKRHLLYSAFSCVILFAIVYVNLDVLRKILPVLVLGTLVLCLVPFLLGANAERNGARRWIDIGPLTFQPSELVKIVILLFLANLFAKKHECVNDLYASVGPACFFLFAYVFVIYLQDDFSTSVFILLLGLFMFFISGVRFAWFAAMFFTFTPMIAVFIFKEQYRINRLVSYFNPGFDRTGIGFQVDKAKAAVSAGGFWGQNSDSPVRLFSSIPEVQSDFVFTGWVEEMGFFGVIIYFAVLAYFTVRGIKVALDCPDRFRSLLAFGATAAIFFQSVMNCGVITGVFPPTGIPLPFFSAGGSSLLASAGLCALIINISRWNSGAELTHE